MILNIPVTEPNTFVLEERSINGINERWIVKHSGNDVTLLFRHYTFDEQTKFFTDLIQKTKVMYKTMTCGEYNAIYNITKFIFTEITNFYEPDQLLKDSVMYYSNGFKTLLSNIIRKTNRAGHIINNTIKWIFKDKMLSFKHNEIKINGWDGYWSSIFKIDLGYFSGSPNLSIYNVDVKFKYNPMLENREIQEFMKIEKYFCIKEPQKFNIKIETKKLIPNNQTPNIILKKRPISSKTKYGITKNIVIEQIY